MRRKVVRCKCEESPKLDDSVKVASHKLVNPYYKFAISFGKGVGMAKSVK